MYSIKRAIFNEHNELWLQPDEKHLKKHGKSAILPYSRGVAANVERDSNYHHPLLYIHCLHGKDI